MELDRFEWLATRNEDAVDPDRRIIDPHHHLWNRGGSTYLADQLLADTGGTHNVTHTVFVECKANYDREAPLPLQPVGETGFVAGEAAVTHDGSGTRIAGIVSFADMTLGNGVETVLAAHEEAGQGLFRGIRHATAWSAHDDIPNAHTKPTRALMNEPTFHEGVAKLGSMGWSFDAWMYHDQLDELLALARALPEVVIVLNHMGGPLTVGPYAGQGDEVRAVWKRSMAELAACPNVVLKVGGIGMDNYYATGWAKQSTPPSSDEVAEHWSDPVHWCIDAFGPDRAMFESNFPVDRQSLTYPVLWNSFQKMAADYSAAEQDDLFWRTAARVYRLED